MLLLAVLPVLQVLLLWGQVTLVRMFGSHRLNHLNQVGTRKAGTSKGGTSKGNLINGMDNIIPGMVMEDQYRVEIRAETDQTDQTHSDKSQQLIQLRQTLSHFMSTQPLRDQEDLVVVLHW